MNIDILKKDTVKALCVFSNNKITNEKAVILIDEYFKKTDIEKSLNKKLVNNITSTSIAKTILSEVK